MNDGTLLLIVRQCLADDERCESLIRELGSTCGLDPYTTRQRMTGFGLVQLAQGDRGLLEKMTAVLHRHARPCWITPSPRPDSPPPRLRSLEVGADFVDFICEGDLRVRLERGATAVGVLADLSGELAGRQVKRLLTRNAYLGSGHAGSALTDDLRGTILKGRPVFDCYLPAAGSLPGAFRVIPGRFNPAGLGERATPGAVRNLDAVVDLVGEYAGSLRLHTDFGLSQLPGCLPQPVGNDPAAEQANLHALNRYGALVAGLEDLPENSGEVTIGRVLTGGLLGVAAGLGVAGDDSLAGGTADLLDEAIHDPPASRPDRARSIPPPLPPPPERPEPSFSLGRALPVVVIFLASVLFGLMGGGSLLRPLFHKAFHTGVLPALAAAVCYWGAFACLRLKRWVEQTPTSRLRSLAMGLVEVRGRAVRRYGLVAPMTQSACVWYRLRKYRRDSNNRWQQSSESDSGHVPFVLDDGSGRVVVDPAGASVRARTSQTEYPGESSLIGAAAEGGPDEKWVEELIVEGTTLYVLGYARPARGVGPGLRERTIATLQRLKLDPQALRRYDSNGDGRLDSDEWQTVRDDAEQLAAAEQLREREGPAADHALVGKAPRGLPFVIAEGQTGAELATRYGWYAAGLLLLGAAATVAALMIFINYFRLV